MKYTKIKKIPLGDLDTLLEYNWKDEEEDYKECQDTQNENEASGHIFESMKRLDVWLKQTRKEAKKKEPKDKRAEFLRDFCDYLKPYMEDDEDLNGGDAVDWLNHRYFEAKELLKK